MLGRILTLAPIALLASMLLVNSVLDNAGFMTVVLLGHLLYSIVCFGTYLPLCYFTETKSMRVLNNGK